MRLFYVALTRAEEKLIITASNKCRKSEKDKNEVDEETDCPEAQDNYFAFMLSRMPYTENTVKTERIYTYADTAPNAEASTAEAEILLPDPEMLKGRLLYKYPYEKATITPAKFTATALGVAPEKGGSSAEEDLTTAFYTGTPLFMKDGQPVSGKELGDIYHCIMEHLDFSAASAEEELKRLLNEKIITEKEKNAVKAAEIQKFLESGLCARAVKSGRVTREFKLFTTVNATGAENPENEDLSFIQGIADMFYEEEDGIVLVDYKTNKNITVDVLKKEYKGQLMIYKKALEEMLGAKVKECFVYSFWLGKEIRIDNI